MTDGSDGLEVLIEDPRWQDGDLDLAALASRAHAAVAARFGIEAAEVAVLGCDDARIAGLNAEFRQRAVATNVLSWPAQSLAPAEPGAAPPPPEPDAFGGTTPLGDVAISYDTCVREAAEQGKAARDHVTHLLVHGMLHLLGFDHETEKDALLMEGIERETLASIGIADPY